MRKLQAAFRDGLASALLNLIWPSSCPLCKGASDNHRIAPICSDCWARIDRYTGPACRICSEPLGSAHALTCSRCLKAPPPFSRVISYGLHRGPLKEAVNLLKFASARRLAGELARLMASSLQLPRADCIVPVPLSARGLRRRGFNQTMLIGRHLAWAIGVPLEADLLYKEKETAPQVGLASRERAANLRGAFKTRRSLVGGEKILLLDDVVTTTATARECSKTLLGAGAAEVVVASVSRASVVQA